MLIQWMGLGSSFELVLFQSDEGMTLSHPLVVAVAVVVVVSKSVPGLFEFGKWVQSAGVEALTASSDCRKM